MLAKNPGFTTVAVITLALGTGANTAIFTLLNAAMLKSLPVANPEQLYRLGDTNNCCVMTGTQGSFVLYSYPLYEELRDHTPEFSELAALTPFLTDLSIRRSGASGPAEPYQGEFVSANYFAMFGIGGFAGRTLTSADDTPEAPPVAVMNYHTWQRHFGLDPSVIGSTFNINGIACTLAGVAPPGFYGDTLRSDPPDFWLPLGTEPALNRQDSRLHSSELEWLYLIGRLRPGVKVVQAQSHLTVELQQALWQAGLASATPEQRNDVALVEAARQEIARQHIRLTPAASGVDRMQTGYAAGLRLLVILSGLVLLITCANIANLLVARGTASRLQTAIRVALGAPRGRLVRQMLTESVLLALLGGGAGLYLAYAGTRAILLVAFRGAHYVPISASPSPLVLAFAFLLSLVTGIVFGIAPAWIASHSDPADALRGAGRSTRDRSSLVRRSLVVLQVALSLVLLAAAGLLTKSLRNLHEQQFGFETQGRLIVKVDPALSGYTVARRVGLYRKLQQRLEQTPGVLSASLSGYSPMEGQNWNEDVYIEGRTPANNSGRDQNSSLDRVGAHYFETIGTRLLRGRLIGDQDALGSLHEAVINRTFAQKFFPGEDPIGQHFGIGDPRHSGDYEIVGIVEDAKYQNAREPAYPTAFLPLLVTPSEAADIHDIELRVAGKPENLERAVRRAVSDIDPNLTVLDMMSFAEQVARNFNQDRLIARLTEFFGLLALVLACVGLYGLTAYSVARRTNEIGIRMTLGANRRNIAGLVLRGVFKQVILGLAIGMPVALVGGRLLSSELFGVKSHDPLILGLTAAILAACGLVAGFIPARRATKVDPLVALRYE
ncbi:MAG: ABC transporter permease [Acidobacteriia bacterium]|nr:ABC transporter permease [Terriglobia bacterium]